jgi:UDP-N-acetyl-D-glucosamine dehydrogenase
MPFYPGPGLGGHCIPIDPFYLSWKARQSGFEARFIELAGQVNSSMPEWVVSRVADALNTVRKAVNGSRIHMYGVAYKKNVGDMRESPAIDVIERLIQRGATVTYSDPHVPTFRLDGHGEQRAIPEAAALAASPDCVVITTDHDDFDYGALVGKAALIMDTRNALRAYPGAHIHRL